MPRGSFTLVFDAQQSPEQATEIFQDFLHPDIAWAKAISLWETAHPPRYRALTTIESKDLVIQAVDELLAGTSSLIRCNFNPGHPVDVAPISAQLEGLTRLEVKQAFRRREPPVVQETRPPLPSWQALADQWEERRPSTDPVSGYHVHQVPANDDYDSDAPENNNWRWESASDSGSDSGSDAASDMTEPTPDDLEAFQEMRSTDRDCRQHMPRRVLRAWMLTTIP
ncbi:hypothetical protein F5X68DRAFT_238322 [Plectosphaerella plurivora]|uniref:Uncharacterized protein n=1 Tax=Plectosphaerella plurivora TaxID=936078 RepID=A0A9P8VM63_9PEZI|nr:hypothetical protein F5X68DRAFT_238322 [Plectosphaerella plurivora]